jgi:hypothetical protein
MTASLKPHAPPSEPRMKGKTYPAWSCSVSKLLLSSSDMMKTKTYVNWKVEEEEEEEEEEDIYRVKSKRKETSLDQAIALYTLA